MARVYQSRQSSFPGHGPIGRKPELIEFRDMLVDIRAKVAALKGQGKSLPEVLQAKPTAAYDAKWGQWVVSGVRFTTMLYSEGVTDRARSARKPNPDPCTRIAVFTSIALRIR